jgi:L-threonine kinase
MIVFAKPGELIQGALPGNKRFLVSNKSSRFFKNRTEVGIKNNAITQQPLNYKSQQAVELFWSSFSNKKKVTDISKLYFKQEGNIPIGKGLSSSSADVLGLLIALTVFYKTGYTNERLYDMAATVEPTDPCLHLGNLLFKQDKGEITHTLHPLPYQLIYFDSDKDTQVDTIALSKRINYSESQQQEFETICNSILQATAHTDYDSFNFCLNKSAEINEAFLPKKKFNVLQDFAIKNKVGLFVAHSGTYMGFVIEPSRLSDVKEKAESLIKKNWNTAIYIE